MAYSEQSKQGQRLVTPGRSWWPRMVASGWVCFNDFRRARREAFCWGVRVSSASPLLLRPPS